MSLFAELKRRNVFRVGIAYLVTAWLLIQVTDILFETIGAPPWVMKAMFVVLAAGFVIALIFAWAFELTPEGVKKERDVDRTASISSQTGQKLNRTIGALLLLALAYIAIDKLAPGAVEPPPDAGIAAVELPVDEPTVSQAPVTSEVPAPSVDSKKSIVVLPFVNMSNDPDQEFFSDGLSEELLNVLAQIKDLRVISRTSAFAFKGKDFDIPTIAARLDVSHVLEGSVRKSGDDIRITAQLIEVATDSHLWSDAYNRKMENVFEIQEEISKVIAQELKVTLGTVGQNGRPTENTEAYQLFLRGRHLYQNRGQEQLARSLDLLEQAVQLDPEFAEAWVNLAAASLVYAYSQKEGFGEFFQNGQRAAMRAIELDPYNGFAHAALGLIHASEFDWEAAMREYDLAIELNPNETNSLLWKGITLLSLGYADQAIALFQQAEYLDPVFTNLQNWLANAYWVKGDLESMRRSSEKISQLDPNFRYHMTGRAEFTAGNLDTAERMERAQEVKNYGSDVLVAAMYAAIRDPGRKEQAVATILANRDLVFGGNITPYLWRIGAIDEALQNIRYMRENGRGLNAINSLSPLWVTSNSTNLSDPAILGYFEASGMAEYWRNHGDPDYCRVDGANIECDSQ